MVSIYGLLSGYKNYKREKEMATVSVIPIIEEGRQRGESPMAKLASHEFVNAVSWVGFESDPGPDPAVAELSVACVLLGEEPVADLMLGELGQNVMV